MLHFLLILSFATPAMATEVPSGSDLLARTIAYHDPEGTWMVQCVELLLETGYADGRTRRRRTVVDFATANYWDESREGDLRLRQSLVGDDCRFWVDGVEESDAARLEELGLNCDRARLRRDYVSYLWGLPMKLRDPGARIDEQVESVLFQEQSVWDLRVTYDAEVGTDVWHIYVEPATGRMVGYAFYKSADETQGEYIVLEDEVMVERARIPARRNWYKVPGDEFLGTDTLMAGRVTEFRADRDSDR